MIEPQDEELHPIGKEKHWQESWYFSWADPRHDVFGLTRIGFRFNENQMDGLVLTIRKGKPEFVYPAVNLKKPKGGWSEQSAKGGLRTGGLVYTCEEPLKRWRITLEGRSQMDLLWESYTPAFDYHDSGRELPPNVAGEHLEQAGRVRGYTRFKGRELEIDGTGERDKSWGVRDWANVEGWNWISAQFGEDLAFNCWEGFFSGKRYINGYIFHGGKNHAIEKLEVKWHWDGGKKHLPKGTTIEIHDESGKHFTVNSTTLGRAPLYKNGLWLEECYSRYKISAPGLSRNGIGIIEHAWHAGTLRAIARTPRVLKMMGQLLLP
ncbi:MAG: hypothetical protein KDH09_17445 [Chrysiogenetes bacterium]|nr:hypothetical protein [Chrysiogenetes bacterium]